MLTTRNTDLNQIDCYYRPQTKFAKVMFLHVSVCPQVGRGRAWQGGVRGGGGVHGRGACLPHMSPRQILQDTVNERAVRILLECILV